MRRKPADSSEFEAGAIEGVVARPLRKFTDGRGWLVELFRQDELEAEFQPAMAYLSSTEPGVTRGPHEHVGQADLFCFLGPANFAVRLWDNRPASATYRRVMALRAGQDNPQMIIIPPGVVHAYRNISDESGLVINCPNRLYQGAGRNEPVDEIRHEDDPDTVFRFF